jgi:Tol biopolymer transport system component
MVGALAVALLAGGTAVALAVTNGGKKGGKTGTISGSQTPSTPVSAAAAPVEPPMPTDTMLVRVDTGGDNPPARHSKIYSFTPGAAPRTILPGTKDGDVLPKWSHDRSQIALTHNELSGHSQVWVMDKDGRHRRELLDGVTGGRVAWSADDKKLAYVKVVNKINQIFVIPVAGGTPRQLTHATNQKNDPYWSADGKSIIYWVEINGVKQIYAVNIANPQEPGRQITSREVGPANDPAPSPDGSKVLYTRELDGGKTSDIWTVDADGSNAHRITSNPAREMDPTWSPDGTWFAFVRGDYNRPTVVAERPDGTGEITLTKPGAREGHPCWY